MTVEGGSLGGMMGPPPGLLGALLGGNIKEGRRGGPKRLGDGSEEAAHARPDADDDDDLEMLLGGDILGGARPHMIIGGPMIMGGHIREMHKDHEPGEEEEGIPPEIQDLMRITEAMLGGGGLFGPPPGMIEIPLNGLGRPRAPEPRHDESHEDVMARMQKMTEELDQISNKRSSKKSRKNNGLQVYQVVAIAGVMVLIMLAAFVMTCRANAKLKNSIEDENDVSKGASGAFGDADSTEISVDDPNERGMKKPTRASKSD